MWCWRVHRLESQWTGSLVDEGREESMGVAGGEGCATSPHEGRGGKKMWDSRSWRSCGRFSGVVQMVKAE